MAYFCQASSLSAFRNISYTSGLLHRELFRVRDRDAMTAVSRLRCVSPPPTCVGELSQVTVRGGACLRLGSRISPRAACKRRTSVTPDRVPVSGSEKFHGRCHVFLSMVFWFSGSSALRRKRAQGLASWGLTCRAMAQTKPESSRATAVTATWDFFLPTRVRWL